MASDAIQFLTVPPSREVAEQGLAAGDARLVRRPASAHRRSCNAMPGRRSSIGSISSSPRRPAAARRSPRSCRSSARSPRSPASYRLGSPFRIAMPLYRAAKSPVPGCARQSEKSVAVDAEGRLFPGNGSAHRPAHRRHLASACGGRQFSDPPAILLTTPESLAQMLAHPVSQEYSGIAALGHHRRNPRPGRQQARRRSRPQPRTPAGNLQRIGLSATCTPLATVAEFLVGADRREGEARSELNPF